MSKLKDVSLKTGAGTPPPATKYGAADHGRTSKMPPMAATPRDNGGLSDGSTDGNFALSGMLKIPNNASATGTQSGSDAAKAAQESNAKNAK